MTKLRQTTSQPPLDEEEQNGLIEFSLESGEAETEADESCIDFSLNGLD